MTKLSIILGLVVLAVSIQAEIDQSVARKHEAAAWEKISDYYEMMASSIRLAGTTLYVDGKSPRIYSECDQPTMDLILTEQDNITKTLECVEHIPKVRQNWFYQDLTRKWIMSHEEDSTNGRQQRIIIAGTPYDRGYSKTVIIYPNNFLKDLDCCMSYYNFEDTYAKLVKRMKTAETCRKEDAWKEMKY